MENQLFQPSLWKKINSWIYPQTIATTPDKAIKVIFSKSNYLLSTKDAYYSNGLKYYPFRIAFNHLDTKNALSKIETVLVLGAGLGSLVEILEHQSYNPSRKYVLVELNPYIKKWCTQYLSAKLPNHSIEFVQSDAIAYLNNLNGKRFDLICVDIFHGRIVPQIFEEIDFFNLCKQSLNTNGYFIMNYIVNKEDRLNILKQNLLEIFKPITVLQENQNLIIIYEGKF